MMNFDKNKRRHSKSECFGLDEIAKRYPFARATASSSRVAEDEIDEIKKNGREKYSFTSNLLITSFRL